jgi:L,D-transpeptidase catalytic domain
VRANLRALVIALIALPSPAYGQVPLLPPPGGSPPPEEQPAPPPDHETSKPPRKPSHARLSNERTHTRWAHAFERALARRRPSRDARAITRLHYDTEDGYPEVYLVLERYTDPNGKRWLKVRLPMRPNGRSGWVPRRALGKLHTVRTFLKIDRQRLRATLYRDGKRVWRAPVGVGKPGTETPGGNFWIRERLHVPSRGSLYGPLAFGTAAYSKLSEWPGGGVVGIHGTNEPGLIPGRPSHGCVRVRNRAILRLGKLMPIGTPVRIR